MRNKLVRLSNLELALLKKAKEMVIKKGTNNIKCECGFKPEINDLSLGNIVYIGIQLLSHLLKNPECCK